eukprot:1253356-Pyramimonas_sp.AAC.1
MEGKGWDDVRGRASEEGAGRWSGYRVRRPRAAQCRTAAQCWWRSLGRWPGPPTCSAFCKRLRTS